jgi:Protein of unknown function (DUF3644)
MARKRRFGSLANELLKKAREAMLTAVQIFNNPHVEFKSELFIVTTNIAWTYLLHAYCRRKHVDYRQFKAGAKRRRFLRTKFGAIKHWSLEECLDCPKCPLEEIPKNNLRFLIGLRHEIEHQMTTRIDDQVSAKFQAAALNFNSSIKSLFGEKHSLDAGQAFSIQFAGISERAAKELLAQDDLPAYIRSFVAQFENGLSQEEYDDPRFSYRVAFIRKTSNTKTGADKVVQMVAADSDAAAAINQVFLRETEKTKYRPGSIVKEMQAEGFTRFGMKQHTDLWKDRDAKDPKFQFGTNVEGHWFWYETWLSEVRKHCVANANSYKPAAS